MGKNGDTLREKGEIYTNIQGKTERRMKQGNKVIKSQRKRKTEEENRRKRNSALSVCRVLGETACL